MKIVFVDVDCPDAYDESWVGKRALGGTESTLLRVASELAESHEVIVAQHNRIEELVGPSGIRYTHYTYGSPIGGCDHTDAVVCLRSWKILRELRKQFPHADLSLWMHCFAGKRWKRIGGMLSDLDANVIAVSDSLRQSMVDLLARQIPYWEAQRRVITIHNPVVVTQPSLKTIDRNKLVYFSSPHKGLDQVLKHFESARKVLPELILHVADPGYWTGPVPNFPEGVIRRGRMTPEEIHSEVASALCVFYPQSTFAETFGLVFAEANALGTPVIAHDLGAAREVLDAGGAGQITDCRSKREVLDKLERWHSGERPRVTGAEKFTQSAIAAKWLQYLANPRTSNEDHTVTEIHRSSRLAA